MSKMQFDTIKELLAKQSFLACPEHDKPSHVCCDASNLMQLGAAIVQDNAPLARHSFKLKCQTPGGKKCLLSIVETLKERRSMLLGSRELLLVITKMSRSVA